MVVRREIVKAIEKFRSKYPVIALTGPRQSGKTTLLRTMFEDYRYISLENPDNRNFAETDPRGFLEIYDKHVVFDEAQRVPKLFSYIQSLVDESGMMGQFILSGSQNFHLMQNITQSLAGRVALFRLFPFDMQELQQAQWLQQDYLDVILKGFYPAIFDRDIPSRNFYSNYLQTYVQRDVTELIAVKDIRLFQNFVALCATRAGQILNLSELANNCGISQPTAKAWLSALEASYITFLLPPYFENLSKRITKTPKLYFYDTGLLCHLLKVTNKEELASSAVKGHLFENMMIAEYVKRMYHKDDVKDLWYWRDSEKNEVDMILKDNKNMRIFEIKATQTVTTSLFDSLVYFENSYGKRKPALKKYLVYGGRQSQKRTAGEVVAWNEFGK